MGNNLTMWAWIVAKWKWIAAAISLVAIPLVPYIWRFHDIPFSTNSADWASFGTYFSGILTPIAGFGIFWQINHQADINRKEKLKLDFDFYNKSINEILKRLLEDFAEDTYKEELINLCDENPSAKELAHCILGIAGAYEDARIILQNRSEENFPDLFKIANIKSLCKQLNQIADVSNRLEENHVYSPHDYGYMAMVLSVAGWPVNTGLE